MSKEHKNYKCDKSGFIMDNKRGQVAIFVIIALVIVAIILVVLLYPRIGLNSMAEISPENYLRSCLAPDLQLNVNGISNQGGYLNPEGYVNYLGQKVKYLCYTSDDYKICTVQQPLLKEQFENDLNSVMQSKTLNCLQNLQQQYKQNGYTLSVETPKSNVTINPNNIEIFISTPMTISKQGVTRKFDGFKVDVESKIYDLLMTAMSIVDYESKLGDTNLAIFAIYYPELRVQEIRTEDGSKIYSISNVLTNETFRFASRSQVWPAGYGSQ